MVIFSPRTGFAITTDDVNSALRRGKDLQDTITTDNIHDETMKTEADKAYKHFKKTRMKEVDAINKTLHYDGKTITVDKDNPGATKKSEQPASHLLGEHERIYLFISSSIPKMTLINYARTIASIKEDRIVMVLRGCVQGCTKIMPTATFIRGVVNPQEGEELNVEVIIDPFLYGLYNITQVPAIVYARNVNALNTEGSEGSLENLNGKPTSFGILGDVAFDYALQNINTTAKSSSLANVLAALQKNWFNSQEK
jgi:type-F conjugative transfer system pilin assembly protein TrbC